MKAEGLEIALVEISTLIEGPDVAPAPGVDQMTADLITGVRAQAFESRGTRPDRSVEELVESDTNGVTSARD